jgi:succinate dehydrogenase flavin-adding protein (antitoxin of CptAB toxin-antitoxin module)
MVQLANKTIENHIQELNEDERKELIELLNQDDNTLNKQFTKLQESVVSKLNTLKESAEEVSVKNRIDETLLKVSQEKYNKLNYFKLKNLSENL